MKPVVSFRVLYDSSICYLCNARTNSMDDTGSTILLQIAHTHTQMNSSAFDQSHTVQMCILGVTTPAECLTEDRQIIDGIL